MIIAGVDSLGHFFLSTTKNDENPEGFSEANPERLYEVNHEGLSEAKSSEFLH